MKRIKFRSVLLFSSLLFLGMALVPGVALAQNHMRSVEGKVVTTNGASLSGAIVFLQDSKTNSIRSFISTSDGSYRFGQLSTDIDYQLWAKYKNSKSATKTLSSFNTRTRIVVDLHIKTN